MTTSRILTVALVLITSVAVACSWLTAFAVSNRSDQPIAVVYQYRPNGQDFVAESERANQGCPLLSSSPPAVADAASIRWWRANPQWRELDSSEFAYDSTSCRIQLELQPGLSVRVAVGMNYTGPKSGRWGELSNLHLEIRSRKGAISYSGFELVRRFRKRSDVLYELSHS